MQKVTIQAGNMAGFAAHSAEDGEPVSVIRSAHLTADDPRFYLYINQIEQEFLAPARIHGGGRNFVVVLHANNSADIYVDYQPIVTGEATRRIEAGEPVNVEDVRNISSYRIPGIEIIRGDRVVCVIQSGWKFGLYFDFTREITDADHVWHQLGPLADVLNNARIVKNIQAQLLEDEKPYLLAEGKTDVMHIEAAHRCLADDLPLGYFDPGDKFGDGTLYNVCEQLARYGPPNKNKVIAIFDRDNPDRLRQLERIGPLSGFQSWGNNVYSFVLPVPPHREPGEKLPIELLYSDADLATTTIHGKRMHFEDEVDWYPQPSGPPLLVVRAKPAVPKGNRKLVTTLASRVVDVSGKQVAISKAHFAQYVLDGDGDFARVDFSGFRGIFEMIRTILHDNGST
ncbi:hypothetical protein [Micromonospora aurantiaca (nom. illeg.)]|uniref:hypothetical protein n=1 Tax=Micromonospora aurantiaca (nom. illeg.) TaxID=47850 RepID=UPI00382B3D55